MRILLFPSEVTEDRKKGKATFTTMNDMDNKGLLVITDLSAIKINFITPDPSIVFDEARGLLSCSLRVNNVPFTRLKDTTMSSVLAKMPEFKSSDQVKDFIDMLSKDPDVQTEVTAKDLVFNDPLKDHKTIVLGTTEKQESADTTSQAVKGEEVKAIKTAVVDPPRAQNTGKDSKAKNLFGGKKKSKQQFTKTVKDPSELPKYIKEQKSSTPPAPEGTVKLTKTPENKKVVTPSLDKQTSSPKAKDQKSDNEVLKEKLAKRLDDDAKLWPGGLVIKSMVPFKEKGFVIGHLFKPTKASNTQFLVVGTPVDGNMPKLTLVFPDEGKAKFYLDAAGKHPKLQKFMEMCSIKPLKDYPDDAQLVMEALLVNDPKTYIEYIVSRSE